MSWMAKRVSDLFSSNERPALTRDSTGADQAGFEGAATFAALPANFAGAGAGEGAGAGDIAAAGAAGVADLETEFAPPESRPAAAEDPAAAARAELASGRPFSLDATLRAVESTYLDAAIEVAQGNMSQAAKLLGISRSTLYSRLEASGRAGAKLATDSAEASAAPGRP